VVPATPIARNPVQEEFEALVGVETEHE
jgi:hypothetical protein